MTNEERAMAAAEEAARIAEEAAAEEARANEEEAEAVEEAETDEAVETEESEEETEDKKENKKFGFGKKKDKESEKLKEELAELKDKYVRQVAEFDNFRKRTEKEKSNMYDIGAMSILEKLLPTIDNFERGLVNAPDDAFAEGMKMVYKELLKNMETVGVKPIEALGADFDPNFHNAVMHEEDESGEENKVSEEFQKGYMYKDHVLRHSMVKVKN